MLPTSEDKRTFTGDNGVLRTASMFYERWKFLQEENQTRFSPPYSLYSENVILKEPGTPLICARATFVEEGDPTGYKWALKYLDGWTHWLKLMKMPWFQEAVEVWLSELEAKLTNEALEKIKIIAKSGSPAAYQANKYLAGQGWSKPVSKRGRPSKTEVEAKLRELTDTSNAEAEDMNRMKPKLVVSN